MRISWIYFANHCLYPTFYSGKKTNLLIHKQHHDESQWWHSSDWSDVVDVTRAWSEIWGSYLEHRSVQWIVSVFICHKVHTCPGKWLVFPESPFHSSIDLWLPTSEPESKFSDDALWRKCIKQGELSWSHLPIDKINVIHICVSIDRTNFYCNKIMKVWPCHGTADSVRLRHTL